MYYRWSICVVIVVNKADPAKFLSSELIQRVPPKNEVVLGGAFDDDKEVWSTNQENDLRLLRSSHEEADTRMFLHAIHSTCDKIVVCARDTDVFLLLVHHLTKINCKELWLMAGTARISFQINI